MAGMGRKSFVCDPDHELAEVPAFEQPDEGGRCILKARDNVLAKLDSAICDPAAHRTDELLETGGIVADDEALHPDASGQQRARQLSEAIRARRRLTVVVTRYQATHRYAGVQIEQR